MRLRDLITERKFVKHPEWYTGKIAAGAPSGVLLVSTLLPDLEGTLNWIQHPYSMFLPHLVVDKDGTIVQTLPLDMENRVTNSTLQRQFLAVALVNPGRVRLIDDGWITCFGNLPVAASDQIVPDQPSATTNQATHGWIAYTPEQIKMLMLITAAVRLENKNPDVVVETDYQNNPGESIMSRHLINGFGRVPQMGIEAVMRTCPVSMDSTFLMGQNKVE